EINGTTIAATVPAGTNVKTLVATFAITGDKIFVGADPQSNGGTANDFSSPVTYTVVGTDGSKKSYTVTVTIAGQDANDLTGFRFLKARNPGLSMDVEATINGTDIAATVPAGTDITNLIADYDTTGASVKIGAAVQTTGLTANNFTGPMTY